MPRPLELGDYDMNWGWIARLTGTQLAATRGANTLLRGQLFLIRGFGGSRLSGAGWVAIWLVGTLLVARLVSAEDPSEESPRRTALVKVIERTLPSVVAIRMVERVPEGLRVHFGSGAILHPEGYILTNAHVIQGPGGGEVLLSDDRVLPFRTLIRFPPEDLAILKVEPPSPLPAVTLGRSHDLLLGEPTVVIGAPTGLARSVSTGIISGLGRATRTEFAFLPSMVQTTAATSGGNSGGPLLNALGEQIGVVTSRDANAQNISFAIVVDHIRKVLPGLVAAEQRIGFRLGIEVDMLAGQAVVSRVLEDSPAASAGLQKDDVLLEMNGSTLRHGVDFHLKLLEQRPGVGLALKYRRGEEQRDTTFQLIELSPRESDSVDDVEPGLFAEAFSGSWDKVPDFSSLKPASTQVIKRVSLDELPSWKDQFSLRITGFIKVPRDGIYAFYTRSDDGSRLWIGDDADVENDGFHATKDAGGLRRLKAGYHALTIGFFEGLGHAELRLFMEGPETPFAEVPAEWLFHTVPR